MPPASTDFITLEMLLSQNTPNLLLPPASDELDLEYLHEVLLETPQSAQGVIPDSPPNVPDPSSLTLQVPAPVDDRTNLCAVCSASTPLLPPPPPPSQTVALPPPSWRKIPQMTYDYGRKQWDYTPSEHVSFRVIGCPGMNMGDALRKKFTDLHGRDDLVLQDASDTISCRFSVRLSWSFLPCLGIDTRFSSPNTRPILQSR